MKRNFCLFLLLLVATLAFSQKLVTGPIIHDFGTFPNTEKKVHVFEIYNSGDKPLMIKEVKVSCGCTSVRYTRKPIKPKKKGYIDVIYDATKDAPGYFKRSVTIYSNSTSGDQRLVIKGRTVEQGK